MINRNLDIAEDEDIHLMVYSCAFSRFCFSLFISPFLVFLFFARYLSLKGLVRSFFLLLGEFASPGYILAVFEKFPPLPGVSGKTVNEIVAIGRFIDERGRQQLVFSREIGDLVGIKPVVFFPEKRLEKEIRLAERHEEVGNFLFPEHAVLREDA